MRRKQFLLLPLLIASHHCGWNAACARFYVIEDIAECPDPTSFRIEPSQLEVSVGREVTITAFFSRTTGGFEVAPPSTTPVPPLFFTTVSDPSIAEHIGYGRVLGRAVGTTTITAETSGGVRASATATLRVLPALDGAVHGDASSTGDVLDALPYD